MTHTEAADLSESAVEALRKAKQAPDFGKLLASIKEAFAEEPDEFYVASGISTVPVYSRKYSCPVLEVRAYVTGRVSSKTNLPFGVGIDEARALAERIVDALNAGRV